MSRLVVLLLVSTLVVVVGVVAVLVLDDEADQDGFGGEGAGPASGRCFPADRSSEEQSPVGEPGSGELEGLAGELVVGGLDQPVDVMQLPGWDLLLVAEKPGRIVAVRDGEILDPPVLDIVDRVSSDYNERGLLTIEAHPEFTTTCELFVFFTDLNGDSNLVSTVVEGTTVPGIDPESMEPILLVPQSHQYHQSGSVTFGPEGDLWVSIGDGGLRRQDRAQDRRTLEGAIIRLDPSAGPHSVPGYNPFGVHLAEPRVWAYGLRNPWRISIDLASNTLYIPDTGSETTEELNVVPLDAGGLNFGWPIFEGSGCSDPADCSPAGLTFPVHHYPRSGGECAIVGGEVYRGGLIPELSGRYFWGDFCSGRVRSLLVDDGEVVELHEWGDDLDIGNALTSFGTDQAGEMYVTTLSGRLWRILPQRS